MAKNKAAVLAFVRCIDLNHLSAELCKGTPQGIAVSEVHNIQLP